MNVYFVVNRRRDWPFETPGATVVTAREYIANGSDASADLARTFNLCRTTRYQGRGYYVSLVAEARGHRPWPDVKTIEDLHSDDSGRLFAGRDAAAMEWTIANATGRRTTVESYFGRDPAGGNDAVARELFALLHAPFVRATFECRGGRWLPSEVRLLYPGDLDETNGRFGATPEFPNGTYHYVLTDAFPFIPRAWRGTPEQPVPVGEHPLP